MDIVLVVAMSENRVIGRDGGLPWHISGDLKHFKAVTMGHPIIMGRKTWQSIGRPLPGRDNIVITRDSEFSADGATVVKSIDAALARCRDAGAAAAMIIGGGQIYAETMPMATHLELTEVHANVDGDTYFPEVDPAEWMETARTPVAAAGDSPAHSFVTLVRR